MNNSVLICGDNIDYNLIEIVNNISIFLEMKQLGKISKEEFIKIKVELLLLK